MIDKYYTPEIEEFHPGFEFESYNNLDWYHKKDVSGWNKIVYDKVAYMKHPIDQIKAALGRKWARVKYLDQEDMESLGFEETYDDAEGNVYYELGGIALWTAEHLRENITIIDNVTEREDNAIFKGVVKNKSELKRILKQIGYE